MCSVKFPGRVLFIFLYRGVRMVGQIQTQKYGFTENFVPKNMGIYAYLLPKNMGDNFSLVINLMVRNYFRGITKMNLEKNGNC